MTSIAPLSAAEQLTIIPGPDPPLISRFERAGDSLHRILGSPENYARSEVQVPVSSEDALGDWWRAYFRGEIPRQAEQSNSAVRTVELFCGSGGLALGFGQAARELGMKTRARAAVDNDAEAVAAYMQNHSPEIASSESVSVLVDYRIKGSREKARFRYEPELLRDDWLPLIGGVDVLLAGPPCQGHSNLNNHSRRTDSRNDLYLTVPAMAIALEAPHVVIENVPAVVHDRTGVVASTTTLLRAAGYKVETGVLKADQMGWPQRRSRFFLVASKETSPIPLAEVQRALASEARSVMWAIGEFEHVAPDDHMLRQPELSEENQRRINWLFENDEHNLANSERPECHQEGTTYTSVYGRLWEDRPSPTITTGFLTPGRGRYVHPTQRRVLRPREAARIQGFPDTYKFVGKDGEIPSSAKLVKWIGDAVPMPLGYAAGLSVLVPELSFDS